MNIELREIADADYEDAREGIDRGDAEADFLLALERKRKGISCIRADDRIVGVLRLIEGESGFAYIYVFPTYRRGGIGSRALELCEKRLRSGGCARIATSYRRDSASGRGFAEKSGYRRKYSSAYMEYSGARFEIPELPVRGYRDDDYRSAHELYAEAFHRMRVSVGDFPDSVVEPPSESMRRYWERTSKERLVYILEDVIVGYAHVEGNRIGSVSVRPECQGRGIGRDFVKYLCNAILAEGNAAVSLYCVVGNRAKELYASLGFEELSIAENAVKGLG